MKPVHIKTLVLKGKSWKLKCDLQRLYPGLYLLKFEPKDRYDMCMTFCRYQEKYESPNPRFRNKNFELVDFMEWYSKDRDGSFTYPNDWAGFNIPNLIFKDDWYQNIKDKNKYDAFMLQAHNAITNDLKQGDKYYLIGATDIWAIKHEMAHGFYYLEPTYKKQMDALTNKLPKKITNKVYSWFKRVGYTPKVFKDEMQAYMSTGFPVDIVDPGKHIKPYKEIFGEVYENA